MTPATRTTRTRTTPVYLDNAATTAVDPRVAARMAECLSSNMEFGNASSASHEFGERALEVIETARAQVAASIGGMADEITFTSGATEADNLAIFGIANYQQDSGRHLVTSRTEHKAVLDPCRELQRRGWQVTYLTPDRNGMVDAEQVAAALRPDTVLVSIMHVNNETGVIQDIDAIGALCAGHNTARLHVDAAQSMGKVRLNLAESNVDLLSLSAHKAYGPKGAGALWVSSRSRGRNPARVYLTPLHFGGGQEGGVRAGTLATHQTVGMGLAFELAEAARIEEAARITTLRDRLWHGLAALGDIYRNGAAEHGVPHILNVSFDGVEGESLLASVRGALAVSTGSACTSANSEPSYVLRAMGRSERLSESSLRFGLGRFTMERDIDVAIRVVSEAVMRLRRLAGTPSGTPYGTAAGA